MSLNFTIDKEGVLRWNEGGCRPAHQSEIDLQADRDRLAAVNETLNRLAADHGKEVVRLAAEVERLTGILTDHNADCVRQCEARKKAGRSHCPMQGYNRLCSDCPRDGMIDQIAASTASGAGEVGNADQA